MNMDRAHEGLLFYAFNVIISLTDWTPNGDIFGIQKLPVNLKEPPNVSPRIKAHQKCLQAPVSSGLIFTVFESLVKCLCL